MIINYLSQAIVAFVLTFISVPFVKKLAFKIGALDHPEKRRVHKNPTPNIGGLAIFFGFIVCLVVFTDPTREVFGLIFGATLMLIMGYIDSMLGLRAVPKLISQIIAAFVLVSFGVNIDFISNPTNGLFELGLLSVPITILWIVGITNAINIIDGLDGLAAGVVTISCGTLAVISYLTGRYEILPLALFLGFSSAAFLPYNFYPAKIFMGDAGSQFLGFSLAAISIMGTLKSATLLSLFVPVLALGIPIFDTISAIIRRLKNKRSIVEADREHLHHLFLDYGYGQTKAVLIIYGLNILFGIVAIVSSQVNKVQSLILFALSLAFMLFVRINIFNKGEKK
jgi:UDP-GlcNAc:undecaprenyl-phosphate/decaprenyl-phosphate GlcNAc-1-phosphate transferase